VRRGRQLRLALRPAAFAVVWLLCGCSSPSSGGADGDLDADVDTDADSDVDTDADSDADSDCGVGEAACDGECVLLSTNEDHCGACDVACGEPGFSAVGWTCLEGECSCATGGGPQPCDGTPTSTCCVDRAGTACFDLTSALDHCGNCSTTCDRYDDGMSDHCESSACVCGDLGEGCRGDLDSTCCMDDGGVNARCANLLTDEADCGACGVACPADPGAPNGDRCRNGQCVCGPGTAEVPAAACPDGEVCCPVAGESACVAGSCG